MKINLPYLINSNQVQHFMYAISEVHMRIFSVKNVCLQYNKRKWNEKEKKKMLKNTTWVKWTRIYSSKGRFSLIDVRDASTTMEKKKKFQRAKFGGELSSTYFPDYSYSHVAWPKNVTNLYCSMNQWNVRLLRIAINKPTQKL